ncbi:amino acid ABC transporter permease [Propionicicella superfundia]|uniref:amino acid ABC transporter permease n=1 Tax=Propionicicella superfundia TaxID=348582 RepID=UPI000415AC50|nr:amino acid ABC transporter permease [Propionicicella superfundia]
MDVWRVLRDASPLLFQGLGTTVLVAVAAILLGIAVGFCVCLLGRSAHRPLRALAAVYVWVVRGTPMIVQAFIVYFGVPQLVQLAVPGFRIGVLEASIVTLTFNAGAYLAEIFRGGIQAVDKGQVEAARSLGMSSSRTMYRIVLPQALRIAAPSMVNQFIITVKDTSILSVIGLADLVNKAKVYVGSSYEFFATYVLVALFYLVLISVLMVVSNSVERRFGDGAQDRR